MKRSSRGGAVAVQAVCALGFLVCLQDPAAAQPLSGTDALAVQAVSGERAVADAAIVGLRARGQEGLDGLLRLYAEDVGRLRADPRQAMQAPTIRKLHDAMDRVAAQRDAFATGLYWYTDQIAAQREARRSGKHVLSLRMLGRLDEELSCANSRLFRTLLYPDPAVIAELRAHFVLHWSSERPAPVITIDMGDGRRLVRTITGNSVHYVLSPDGETIDAIPGMWAPAAFVSALRDAKAIADACGGGRDRACVATQHRMRREAIEHDLKADTRNAGFEFESIDLGIPDPQAPAAPLPNAMDAERMTSGKSVMEVRSLRLLARNPDAARLDAGVWEALAARHVNEVVISEMGARMVGYKSPEVPDGSGASSWERLGTPLRLLVASDTARNRFLQRARVDTLFADGRAESLRDLNTVVYAALFLTPAADPWMGLVAPELFTGLDPDVERPR